MPHIKLITFDLDDTLWDNAPTIHRAENAVYQWCQQYYPALTEQYSLHDLRQLRQSLMQQHPAAAHRVTAMRIQGMETALIKCGLSQNDATRIANEAFAIFLDARHNVALFPGVHACLSQLSQQFMLASLTNGNIQLDRLGLQHYFAFSLHAENFEAAKPHPAMFMHALKRANVRPENVLHIGDHPQNDVMGAMRLGMHALWFNAPRAAWIESTYVPTLEVQSIDEIVPCVSQWLQIKE